MRITPSGHERSRYTLLARAKVLLTTNPVSLLERFGLILALAAMAAAFSLSNVGAAFTSTGDINNILVSGAIVGVIALAMLPPLIAGHFDLSVAAVAAVSNIAVASAIGQHGMTIFEGIVIGIVLGGLIGTIQGFLVAKMKLNAFIVTFGSYTFLQGIATLYTHGTQIASGIPASLGAWTAKNYLGIPRPFVALLVIAALLWFALSQIPWGRYLEAIGSNEPAARLVGINVDRAVWVSFIVSGTLAGLAGVLLTSNLGVGDPTAGLSYLFPAFAAVFLGATTIRPGRYNVIGTLVGVYFVQTAVSGLSLLGAQTWVQPTFDGAALIVAVGASTYLIRTRQRHEARLAAERHKAAAGTGREALPNEPQGA